MFVIGLKGVLKGIGLAFHLIYKSHVNNFTYYSLKDKWSELSLYIIYPTDSRDLNKHGR